MAFAQTHYRLYDDDDAPASATPLAALNTAATIDLDVNFLARIESDETSENGNINLKLQYRVDTGVGFGDWADVTTSTPIQLSLSSHFANGDATTDVISGSGKAFAAGFARESTNAFGFSAGTSIAHFHSEQVACLLMDSAQVSDGDVFELRLVLSDGTAFGTYTNTPSITANLAVDYLDFASSATITSEAVFAGRVVANFSSSVTITSEAVLAGRRNEGTIDLATAFREYEPSSGLVVDLPDEMSDFSGNSLEAKVSHPFTDADPYLRIRGPSTASEDVIVTWDRVGLARADLDRRVRFVARPQEGSGAFAAPIAFRVGGSAGSEDGYLLEVRPEAGTLALVELSAGTKSTIGTPVAHASALAGVDLWIRVQAIGTAIKAKLWEGDEADEPGAWELSETDATHTEGRVGWGRDVDVYYDAVRTTADQAPLARDDFGPGLEELIADPVEPQWEWTVEVEAWDPDADEDAPVYLSTKQGGRTTGGRDSPPNVAFHAGLTNWPDAGFAPFADAILSALGSASAQRAGAAQFSNIPAGEDEAGPHDTLLDLTAARRGVVVRVGRPEAKMHRSFSRVATGYVGGGPGDGEPKVSLSSVSASIGAVLQRLDRDLDRDRCVGIPTGIEALTATGEATDAYNAAFDLVEFCIVARFRDVAADSPTLISKESGGEVNFKLALSAGSVLEASYTTGSGATTFALADPGGVDLEDGGEHEVLFAIGSSEYLLIVDGRVFTGTHDGVPDTPAGELLVYPKGIVEFDLRVYSFAPSIPEAQALLASLPDVDDAPGLVAWWKCDDNGGGTVTDYHSGDHHLTLGGVEDTDYQWEPTYAGEEQVAGVPHPILVGYVNNAPVLRIDTARDLYQVGVEDDVEVRDQGEGLVENTDYTEEGGGVVDFVDPGPGEPVTVGWPESNRGVDSAYYTAQMAADVLTSRGGLTRRQVDLDAAHGAALARPFYSGWWSGQDASAATFLGEVLPGAGLCYWEDRYGRVILAPTMPPIGLHPRDGEPMIELVGYGGAGAEWGGGSVDPSTGSYSITFECKPTVGGATVIGVGTGSQLSVSVSSQGISLSANDGESQFTISCPLAYRLGSSLFVGVTWDDPGGSNDLVAYVAHEGEDVHLVPVQSGTLFSLGLPGPVERFFIGTKGLNSAGRQSGAVCGLGRVAVWDKALSLAELQAIHDDGVTVPTANLIRYVPCTDRSPLGLLEEVSGERARMTGMRWTPRYDLDLTTSNIEIVAIKEQTPARAVRLRYNRNFKVLDHSDIAAAVSASDRLRWTTDWETVPQWDQTVADDYAGALDFEVDSALRQRAHAERSSKLYAERLRPGWAILDLAGLDRRALSLTYGDEIRVTHPRLGADGGALDSSMRVVSVSDTRDGRYSAALWGKR